MEPARFWGWHSIAGSNLTQSEYPAYLLLGYIEPNLQCNGDQEGNFNENGMHWIAG
jgi:hypothetical protein